jgi:hypothetical protein
MNIILTETKNFWNCAQIYNPSYRNMDIKQIEKEQQSNLKTYLDVGYNSFLFNRNLATIYIRKVEIKTLEDIFETDVFGLLND